jgi:hypothetical protein
MQQPGYFVAQSTTTLPPAGTNFLQAGIARPGGWDPNGPAATTDGPGLGLG